MVAADPCRPPAATTRESSALCWGPDYLARAGFPEGSAMAPLKISAEEFVGRLAERAPHTQHAFLLGAGCSVGSGIPAAGTLVRDVWLPRLFRWRAVAGESFEEWSARAFADYDPASPALSYGAVMEELFPRPLEKQKEVERICRG